MPQFWIMEEGEANYPCYKNNVVRKLQTSLHLSAREITLVNNNFNIAIPFLAVGAI